MPSDLAQEIRREVGRMARGGELASLLGGANASAVAQKDGNGIGIQNVRRGVARAVVGPSGSNIVIASSSFAVLPTEPLSLTMTLSGRPLLVAVHGLWSAGTSGFLAVDVALRGALISGSPNGLARTDVTAITTLHGEDVVMAPAAGAAGLEVYAMRGTSNGFIYTGSVILSLLAVEL